MTVVTWLGCDLVTGQIVEELPDLKPSGPIGVLLGAYTSASFGLPIPLGGNGKAPKNWEAATQPGRSMIVAVLAGQPIWAGIVLPRKRGTVATAALSCVSIEGYLDRRYVGDHTWTQQDQSSVIAAGLLGDATVEGIGLQIDAPASGVLRDRSYRDQDDKTVYSSLRELMAVQGGPEWTIRLDWTDATQTAVAKTAMVRDRIGYASSTPNAVFSTGSASAVFSAQGVSDTTYENLEDYSSGKGANHVVATSSGQGDSRPQSVPARAEDLLAAGWPRYEYRYTPSTSITDQATLDAHAAETLVELRNGTNTLALKARADVYPVLGTDWWIGDDIGHELIGHGHPTGLVGVARAIGWNLDPVAGTVEPILWTPDGAS